MCGSIFYGSDVIESQMQLLNKFRPIVYELVTVHFSVQGQTNLVAEKKQLCRKLERGNTKYWKLKMYFLKYIVV